MEELPTRGRISPMLVLDIGTTALLATFDNTLIQMYREPVWFPVAHIRVEQEQVVHRVFDPTYYNRHFRQLWRLSYPILTAEYPNDEDLAAYLLYMDRRLPDTPAGL